MQVFSNNASTTLAADLSAVATSMTVTASTGFAALTSPQFEFVTVDDGIAREIIKVTARSGNTWTIERAQEGTTAALWDAGVSVEARLTAGTLTAFVADQALMGYNAPGGDALGTGAISMQPARAASSSVASGEYAIALGTDSSAIGAYGVAIGYNSRSSVWGACVIGPWGVAAGQYSCVMGAYAEAGEDGVAIGATSFADALGSVAIGRQAFIDDAAPLSVAIGRDASVQAASGVAVGNAAASPGAKGVAIGEFAYAVGDGAVSLGAYAWPEDDYTAHCSALWRHVAARLFEISNEAERQEQTAYFSAPVMTVMSDTIGLAATGSVNIVLPPNTQLYVDTIGLIVVSAASPAGSPAISVHDLTSEAVTVTAAGERQLWKDIDGDAVTGTMTVTVDTALTSGAMSVRVYLSGVAVQV